MFGTERAPLWVTAITCACLGIPLALPEVFGYETNPAFLLAPFVALAILHQRDQIVAAFGLAIICGVASILISARIQPDGRLLKDFLSLLLLAFSAGFYFLGREMGDIRRLVLWLAAFSAAFVIPASLRLIVLGEPGRILLNGEFAYFNVYFFGWPMFAAFGVNASSHLICIQAALIVGALLGAPRSRALTAFLLLGLTCASHLIVGSNSRSAVMALALIAVLVAAFVLKHRNTLALKFVPIALAICIGWAANLTTHTESRVAEAIIDVAQTVDKYVDLPTADEKMPAPRLDAIASGRLLIAGTAIREFLASPMVGSGFSPFGRYVPVDGIVKMNSTSHVYYLTILWKGGLLFGIPFFTFLGMAAWSVLRSGKWKASPEATLALIGVVVTFGPVSLTYDTPNVPSAGALAFLLLGALGQTVKGSATEPATAALA